MKKAMKTCIPLILLVMLLLSALPASAAIYGDYAVVSGSSTLNLRHGPGTSYQLLYTAHENDWVMIMYEEDNWYKVRVMSNGMEGYMSKNFLTVNPGSSSSGPMTGVVTNPRATQYLNLRQYPSTQAPVLGIFYNGARFNVLSAMDGWYQVEMNGMTGYFMKQFVTVNGGTVGTTAVVSAPNSGKTNLRSAPSRLYSTIIAQYPNGTPVQVLYKGSDYWKVMVNSIEGYMDSSFLRLTPSGSTGGYTPSNPTPTQKPDTQGYAYVNNPIATQVLNLREQASTTSKVIAQYKNGVRFHVISPGEMWTKVYGSATGNVGYFMTRYLNLQGTDSTIKTIQNGNTYVNFRSAPSTTSSTIYNRLYTGTQVTVITPGDQWTQVRYNGHTGYVMTQFLK